MGLCNAHVSGPTSSSKLCQSFQSSGQRSPLSSLLNLPAVHQTRAKKVKTGKARVLTSAECLCLLKEKEAKRKQEVMNKEQRKLERERKKIQKEQEQKRKAEEKAQRLAKREAMKENVKCRKRNSEEGTSSFYNQHSKRLRQKKSIDEPIDTQVCCVCFGLYLEDTDTDMDWVCCCCGRWLHEDCIDEDDIDNTRGKICPVCL